MGLKERQNVNDHKLYVYLFTLHHTSMLDYFNFSTYTAFFVHFLSLYIHHEVVD